MLASFSKFFTYQGFPNKSSQVTGILTMNHINNNNLAEVVDMRNSDLGIFRD